MATNESVTGTPYYLLMQDKRRLGPAIIPPDSGVECSVTYGFSDKTVYDRFRGNSKDELQPYPLVRVFLRDQAESPDDGVRLLVLDAVAPDDRCLQAATMAAVLEAHESRTTHLTATHCLTFDPQAKAYQLEVAGGES